MSPKNLVPSPPQLLARSPAASTPAEPAGNASRSHRRPAGRRFVFGIRTITNASRFLIVLIGGLVLAPAPTRAAQAASARGSVSGQVSNQATGAYLQGALVTAEGTAISTSTERDGSFRLSLPAGTHTIVASYSGLDAARVEVTVPAGATVSRNFSLTTDIYRLSPFVVATEREGNALAITHQRLAPNVKNVVSADAFGSLSGNPAELLERITGVVVERVGGDARYISIRGVPGELNSIQIDGNRRASYDRGMAFESIGSDHIESIELTKSPTPDMDADAIGGTVNLKSRSAFDLTGRRISYSIGGLIGHRRYEDPRPAATFHYSDVLDVLGGPRNLGVSLSANFRQHVASMDFSTFNYQSTPTSPAFINNHSFDGRINQRSRWGGGLKLDYKLSENNVVFANFTLSPHSERAHVPVSTLSTAATIATLDAQGQPTGTGAILPNYTDNRTEARPVAQSQVAQSYLHRERDNDAYSAQFGGRVKRESYELDYDVSYSLSKQKQFYHQSSAAVTGVGWIIDRTGRDPWLPQITFTGGPDPFNLDNYRNNLLLRFHQPIYGEIYGSQVNYLKRFDTAAPAYLKTGFKFRSEKQDRKDLSQRWRFAGPNGVLNSGDENLSQFVSEAWTYRPNHGHHPAFPILSPKEMSASLAANPGQWQEDVAYGSMQRLINRQVLEESVTAAYVLGGVNLGKLSILAGVRVENTRLEGEGPLNQITPEERARRAAWGTAPLTNEETIRRNIAQYGARSARSDDYRHAFPGVHLKFEPRRGLIFRGSYSGSIGRPLFTDLFPRLDVDDDNRTVNVNNTGLKPQYSDNFDLTAEYYFEPVGLFSVSAFLKEIKDYIYSTSGSLIPTGTGNGFDGEYAGYELRSKANGGFGRIRGWEASYQQQFTFLPGWLAGFGAFTNYTWLETQGDYGTTNQIRDTDSLPNFTPRAANVGISYIRGKWNLRVFYSHSGKTLTTFNALPQLKQYRLASNRIDVKIKYPLGKHHDVYLDIYNLTNDYQKVVAGVFDRPRSQLNRNDPQFHFGVNGRF